MKTTSPLFPLLLMMTIPALVIIIIRNLFNELRQRFTKTPIVNQVEPSETDKTLEEVEKVAEAVGAPKEVQSLIDVAQEVSDVVDTLNDLFKPKAMEMQPVFIHNQHGEFHGTSLELRQQYGLHRGNMSELMNNKRSSVGGWSLR